MKLAGDKLRYEEDEAGLYKVAEVGDTVVASAWFISSEGNSSKLDFATVSTDYEGIRYNLRAAEDIVESYYISMYTYNSDNNYEKDNTTNSAYGFTVASEKILEGEGGNIPMQFKGNQRATVYLGKLFTQEFSIEYQTEEERISSNNNKIDATLQSKIYLHGDNASYFQAKLSSANIPLYQGFYLYLNRYDNETLTDQSIKGSPMCTYDIYIDGIKKSHYSSPLSENAQYVYIEPVQIDIPEYDSSRPNWESIQKADISLTFSTFVTELKNEFPIRTSGDSSGISLSASANIDYTPADVPYSSIKATYQTPKRYYIESQESISLRLTPNDQPAADEYDKYGEQSSNKSALGINAYYIETGSIFSQKGYMEHIEAAVEYNIDPVSDEIIDSGDYSVILKIKLLQKQDGGDYKEVNLHEYLNNFELRGKDGENLLNDLCVIDNGYQYKFDMSNDKTDWEFDYTPKVISGTIAFDAKTGSDWLKEVKGSHYGNYKLVMNAQIIKTDTNIKYGNVAEGNIVYTNAKVNAQFVTKKAG